MLAQQLAAAQNTDSPGYPGDVSHARSPVERAAPVARGSGGGADQEGRGYAEEDEQLDGEEEHDDDDDDDDEEDEELNNDSERKHPQRRGSRPKPGRKKNGAVPSNTSSPHDRSESSEPEQRRLDRKARLGESRVLVELKRRVAELEEKEEEMERKYLEAVSKLEKLQAVRRQEMKRCAVRSASLCLSLSLSLSLSAFETLRISVR